MIKQVYKLLDFFLVSSTQFFWFILLRGGKWIMDTFDLIWKCYLPLY